MSRNELHEGRVTNDVYFRNDGIACIELIKQLTDGTVIR